MALLSRLKKCERLLLYHSLKRKNGKYRKKLTFTWKYKWYSK